ncbi:ABC transporter substrate-binding protein [Paenibacillus aurantiacus]|uniref:ABC transporter substrate-binding protein n=1 Tax=Paenibacillus aurantiacus TaxID=1936118 RepID=A0ABV5KIX3_9BACL
MGIRRKWQAKAALAGLAATLTIAGCASGNETANEPLEQAAETAKADQEAAKAEPFTLQVAVWDEKLKETVQQTFDLYKREHPEADFKLTVTPVKEYYTKLQTALIGGSGPDLFMMNGPNFNKFASLKLLTDLQPLVEQDALDTTVYPDGITKLYQYEGHQYGLPYYLGSIGLFYNKALFDAAKVPYPDETWTWETLRANAAKLTDKTQGTYGYIAANDNQSGVYPLIYQAGGSVISEGGKKSGLDAPESVAALQFMKDLIDEGISPSAQQQLETAPIQLFGSGKAAMVPGGSYDASTLHGMLGDKLGVAPLPAGKQAGFLVHGSSWVINSKSEHQQEAWAFLKVLTGAPGAELLAKNAVNFPAYKDAVALWMQSIPTLDMNAFVRSLENTGPYPVSKNTAEWQNAIIEEITNGLLGKQSIPDAAAKAASRMNEILAKE